MRILVVDDDTVQRELLSAFLSKQGHEVFDAADGAEAMDIFHRKPIQVVLLDQKMPGFRGDQVLEKMKSVNPMLKAIMITAYGDIETAVTAMKLGAQEFIEKPVDLEALLEKLGQMEQQVSVDEDVKVVEEHAEEAPYPIRVIAESPGMREVLSLARRVADSPWAVLIEGETGTGKELIARLIHLMGPRKPGPFIEVNCAAVPENLFESELFGHEKGAFTGATARRRGRFELADGGTLFLDEIGETPLLLQTKLLRALQEKRFIRVGGEKEIPVDLRVISATNRDLKQMVNGLKFREDLYYRLKVLEIAIPPLRERREDIPLLVEFFLERYATRSMKFSPEALDALIKYTFPGNVRELEHVVQRTVTLARTRTIFPSDLPDEIRRHRAFTQGSLQQRLDALEKDMVLSALEKSDGVQTKASRLLGISERVLRYKMKRHRIRPGSVRKGNGGEP